MKILVVIFLFLQDQPKWIEKINESPLILGLIILAVVSLIAVIIKKEKSSTENKEWVNKSPKKKQSLEFEESINIKKEKSSTENKDWVNKSPKKKQLLEFEESINAFLEKMNNPSIGYWYGIVQQRGEGQALMADASSAVKEDDYNYWAEGHLEEYLLRINSEDEDMRLDKEAFLLRIKVFSEIIDGLEEVIRKAEELELNITKEMASDYHAAIASKLGAEMGLNEIN